MMDSRHSSQVHYCKFSYRLPMSRAVDTIIFVAACLGTGVANWVAED